MYVTPPDTDIYAIPKVLAPMPQKVPTDVVLVAFTVVIPLVMLFGLFLYIYCFKIIVYSLLPFGLLQSV